MKYIIMCGGTYHQWMQPRQLIRIRGEPNIERTIRLLRENGITDIAISSNNEIFDGFGVPVLHHENSYTAFGKDDVTGLWVEAFYPTEEPVCYLFGDVVFSPDAIRTIVGTSTDDIMFFASCPPFAPEYHKPYAEPFALKVVNQKHLQQSIEDVKRLYADGMLNRKPIMWELWQVIIGGDPKTIDYGSYTAINDYTCDIDYPSEKEYFEKLAP